MITYFTYIFLLFSLFFLTSEKYNLNNTGEISFHKKFKINFQMVLSLLLISLIVGYRYNVGNDWEGYKDYFLDLHNVPIQFNFFIFEPGYFLFNKIASLLGFSYQFCFFLFTFFTWYLIYRAVPKEILSLFIFFIFCNELFFWSMNGIRQFIAIAFLLNAVKYVYKRKVFYFFLSIFLGSLFHQTISIFYLLYFIPTKYFYNRIIMVFIFLLSLFLGNNEYIISELKSYVEQLSFYLNFGTSYIEGYIYRADRFFLAEDVSLGLGYYFIIISNLLIIIFSGNLIKKYPSLKIYFFLFFMGSILYNLFNSVHIIQRINQYFLIFKPLILSYYAYYYYYYKNNELVYYPLFILFFLFYMVMIFNSSNMCNPYIMRF